MNLLRDGWFDYFFLEIRRQHTHKACRKTFYTIIKPVLVSWKPIDHFQVRIVSSWKEQRSQPKPYQNPVWLVSNRFQRNYSIVFRCVLSRTFDPTSGGNLTRSETINSWQIWWPSALNLRTACFWVVLWSVVARQSFNRSKPILETQRTTITSI